MAQQLATSDEEPGLPDSVEDDPPLDGVPLQSSSVNTAKTVNLQQPSDPAIKSMSAMSRKSEATEQFLAGLVPVSVERSAKGQVEFKDLFIPPPPAPSLENLLGTGFSSEDVKTPEKNSIKTDKTLSHSPRGSPSHTPTETVVKRRSTHNREEKKASTSLSPKKPKISKEREKLLKVRQEKYALTGK